MNSCVVKNKEFYAVAEEHSIDGNELELIVHKYWNEVGNEDSFPPSSYINDQLGIDKTYDESGENVIKLYEAKYARPITFDSQYDLNAAKEAAKKFFPEGAINTYKNNKGKYVLRIAKPINKQVIAEEMQSIKEKATANGTFMKAPNGKQSNLNEQQWLQVRTTAFKEWFGNWENDVQNASKVVDENGEPLVVYHNSDNTFTKFDKSKIGSSNDIGFYGKGFYFTKEKSYASTYGENTYEVFLNIRKPFIANTIESSQVSIMFNREDDSLESYAGNAYESSKEDLAKADGVIHDGPSYFRGGETVQEYVIKNSNQIKSATDNIGTFSTENNDIYQEHFADSSKDLRDSELTSWVNSSTRDSETYSYHNIEAETIIEKLQKNYNEILTALNINNDFDNILNDINFVAVNTLVSYNNASIRAPFNGRRAYYNAKNNTIYIDAYGQFTDGNASSVIMHELMHAFTVNKIKANPELRDEFERILDEYNVAKNRQTPYYTRSERNQNYLEEFIADIWSDKQLIDELKTIKSSRTNNSLFDRIWNIFKDLLKGSVKDSLFEDASNRILELLESPTTISSKDKFYEHQKNSYLATGLDLTNTPKATYKDKAELNGVLAKTSADGTITIAKDITTQDVINYAFKGEPNSLTSKQKQEVFSKLQSLGITEEAIKNLINKVPNGATWFLYYHELSHLQNQDRNIYWEAEDKNTDGSLVLPSKRNYMTVNKLAIEARATIDAYTALANKVGESITTLNNIDTRTLFDKKSNNSEAITANNTLQDQQVSNQENTVSIASVNPEGPLKGFTLHSGGAIGADFVWGNIGAGYGVEGKHYFDSNDTRPNKKPLYANTPITDEERIEGERRAFLAGHRMGRLNPNAQKVSDPLLIRDWNQVKNADAVFAIAQKFDMPGDKFSNKPNDERVANIQQVSGGAGWAVQMAIIEGKPIFVFNQADGKWYSNIAGVWNYCDVPTLTPNFAGIGTTGLNALGEAAIKAVYEKTIQSINQGIKTTTEETIQASDRQFDLNSLSPEMRKEWDRLQDRATRINNLLSSDVMTQSEVREACDSIINLLSDHITQLIEDANNSTTGDLNSLLVNQVYNGQPGFKPFNPKFLSRAEIFQKIGINNLINKYILLTLKPSNMKEIAKIKLIKDNIDGILYLGAEQLSLNEGIHISTDINGTPTIENGVIINPDLNGAQDTESIQENEGSLQEKWQVDSRTVDTLDSMSQIVRTELSKLYLLDKDGNKIKGQFGIYKRVKIQDATKQLLTWCQGSLTLRDAVSKLKTKQAENPWVKQLIDVLDVEELKKKSPSVAGMHTDFQNSFFSTFNKHFQSYRASTIEYKNDQQIIRNISLNEKPVLKEIVNSIRSDAANGLHNLIDKNNHVNQLGLTKLNDIVKNLLSIKENKLKIVGINKMTEADRTILYEQIAAASSLLGYPVDKETLANTLTGKDISEMITHVKYIYDDLLANANNSEYKPFSFSKDGNKISGISNDLRKFLDPLTRNLQDIGISSLFDSGKMYQSYVTPSYMTKLMLKFAEQDPVKFEQFIQDEFGKYDWFRDTSKKDIRTGWRNGWLARLAKDPEARKIFKHCANLNYNKHNYMRDMTGNEYILSLLSNFFAEGAGKGKEGSVAWFKLPILSNKPSEEYVRFYAEVGANFKDRIIANLSEVFNQELSRIQTVRLQNFDKSDPRFIKSFHTNGGRFCFLDFLNDYLLNNDKYGIKNSKNAESPLGELLNAKLAGKTIDEVKLKSLVTEAIKSYMENRVNGIMQEYKKRGILETAKNIKGINDGYGLEGNIERFLWNDTYATTQIIQLTVTDIAYYKDMEDLQKRIAQIHAPGIRGNAEAVDYDGNRVSDGIERTMYLTDFDKVKSNIIENVSIVFNRKLEEAKRLGKSQGDLDAMQALHKSIISQFEEINVADAQGYSSPSSYRKKMFIFGKWSRDAEALYNKIKTGKATYSDYKVAFQPLKPFVYSQIEKPVYIENAPMQSLKMPVQNKNSEYLLIMADAILQGEDTGKPNLLRAIYEVMEESAEANKLGGIDTIQFESTVKSGLMGRMDINKVLNDAKWSERIETTVKGKQVVRTRGEAAAKAYMQSCLYTKNAEGVVSYNPTFVHEIPFEDYCIQQEVPEHFKDHEQQHGSQIRMITPSDLLSIDTYGNPVTYKVEGRDVTAKEFRTEYENTIADNIQNSIDSVFDELHLNSLNQVERNIVLSRMLQREILSSPRYGLDMFLACSLDPMTGDFRIPLGDPIQANRIEQLLNSIVKKRINEQKIAGGPVVQVTNFGTSDQLNIKFKSKDGGLLLTRKEFVPTDKYKTYEDYIKAEQAGIAYFEVYAPIFSESIFRQFTGPDGIVDIATMEKIAPEALQMIGYRIPTEDKYSCAPLKIVGFLPREAGEGIMLPYDITLLTGSDFDVDKEYLMRKQINITAMSDSKCFEALKDTFFKEYKKEQNLTRDLTDQEEKVAKKRLYTLIDAFKTDPARMIGDSKLEKVLWNEFKNKCYIVTKDTSGKIYNDNKIFDMTWEVLTHETTADKMLNPGGFEEQKRVSYKIAAFKNSRYTWDELDKMSTDDLKKICYSTKNLIFSDAQIQFYEQNNAASTILGMFAVQKIGHAVLEGNDYQVDITEVCETAGPFTILGKTFKDKMTFDPMLDDEGNVIGKTLGSHVAAAADAGKEPCMNLTNINSMTANVHSTLIRLGMPYRNAALLLAQPVITDLLSEYSKRNLTDFATLDTILQDYITSFREEGNMYDSALDYEDITQEELINNLRANKDETNYKVALAFSRLQNIAHAIKGPTFITRFNSISNAVGPLITDNLITEYKTNFDTKGLYTADGRELNAQVIFEDHPILAKFADAYNVANTIFEDFPTRSAAFREILNSMPDTLAKTIYNDRGLLNQLKDFFISHALVDNHVVNENRTMYYVKDFAKEFLEKGYKAKNADNEFIQAIQIKQDSDTGECLLELPTTGMDQSKKDRLSSAWYDLYIKNPALAKDIFYYNFFKGGIGFNPKTFINLLPLQMREKLPGYKESFRNIPVSSAKFVFEQFLAHNTSVRKLFPERQGKKTSINGKIFIPMDVTSHKVNLVSFRQKDNHNIMRYYYKEQVYEDGIVYKEIVPLGENGSYLEMSSSNLSGPSIASITKKPSKKAETSTIKQSDIVDNSAQPIEDINTGNIDKTPAQEKAFAEKIIENMIGVYPGISTKESAKQTLLNIKNGKIDITNPVVDKYLKAVYDKINIKYEQTSVLDQLKEIC